MAHVLDLEELEIAWNLTCTVYNDSLLEQHCSTRRDCETIEVGGTRAVVDASAGGATHVCFRGTATNHDVAMDLYYHLKPLESFTSLDIGGARAASAARYRGLPRLPTRRGGGQGGPVVLSGHSLGGALALIAGVALEASGFFSCRVVTFGAPPAGDARLAALCDGMLRHTRFTLRSDPIPKLGSGFLPLEHVRDFAHAGDHVELEGWGQTAKHALHALSLLAEPAPAPAPGPAAPPPSFWDVVKSAAAARGGAEGFERIEVRESLSGLTDPRPDRQLVL
ncbi:lipase [Aureococcus anophagefferens]|nr:lipase [Aureococcus anophagefferens]